MTVPMTGMTGYVTYLEFAYGSNKGQTAVGDLIESPFARGKVDSTFTASSVQEGAAMAQNATTCALNWGPVIPGTISFKIGTTNYLDNGNGVLYSYADSAAAGVTIVTNYVTEATDPNNGHLEGVAGRLVKTITGAGVSAAGTVTYGLAATKGVRTVAAGSTLAQRQATDGTGGMERIYDASTPVITFSSTPASGAAITFTVNYQYNNIAIPQADLPMITAQMKGIALEAKARRIAVAYSQMAAFQSKQDYGQDIGELLSKRAVAELGYKLFVA